MVVVSWVSLENSAQVLISKMQKAGKIGETNSISPDITCLPFTFPSKVSSSLASPAGKNCSISPSTYSIGEIPQGLYDFIVSENGEMRILCKICHYVSNKKSNFKRHFINMHFVHTEDGGKQLECCGIRFSTKGEKFHHTKSIHKFGYKCSICAKVFDRPALLQRHLAKHTGKKPYKCSLCAYQTPNKANAKRHIDKKHSEVKDGSILFVTDDGEQIQMEIVSKIVKSGDGGPSKAKSSPDASFGLLGDAQNQRPNSFKLPRHAPSATVTSSSTSSPDNVGADPSLTSNFDIPAIKKEPEDKKRQIGHSIEKIIGQEQNTMMSGLSYHSSNSRNQFETMNRGNSASLTNPEKPCLKNNHPDINKLYSEMYCSPNWPRASSLMPINNSDDYAAAVRQSYFLPQNYSTSASVAPTVSNRSPSSHLPFPRYLHGCWHHVLPNNQFTSVFSPSYEFYARSFLPRPSAYNILASPDLCFPSPISQQTENSSINSVKEEDDDDSEIIDVVGGLDENDTSTICEGLGSCATAEVKSEQIGRTDNEVKREMFQSSPPVDSLPLSRRNSISLEEEDGNNNYTGLYIPKKLRASRRFLNN